MQNFGLIRESAGRAVLKPIPIPQLKDDYILVRTVSVALNPTDWTTLDAPGDAGTLVGCDYAGIVEEVGKTVTKDFKKGDRVAGFAHGGNDLNPQSGAFARFIVAKGDIQLHIPDNVSFEAACTVAVGVASSGYGLYNVLGLPFPSESTSCGEDEALLIYGGSTATGSLAIQFAKLSGREVFTTCSPKHFELMKELGASHVYDYRVPRIGEQIRIDTHGKLKTVFDTVALESTAAICAGAFSPEGGKYCSLLDEKCPHPDVESSFFLGYGISGESYIFEREYFDARPQDFDFAIKFIGIAEKLWAEGKWKPHPRRVGSGGLLGVLDGMQQMREGRYSGEKLVYLVDDTKWSSS